MGESALGRYDARRGRRAERSGLALALAVSLVLHAALIAMGAPPPVRLAVPQPLQLWLTPGEQAPLAAVPARALETAPENAPQQHEARPEPEPRVAERKVRRSSTIVPAAQRPLDLAAVVAPAAARPSARGCPVAREWTPEMRAWFEGVHLPAAAAYFDAARLRVRSALEAAPGESAAVLRGSCAVRLRYSPASAPAVRLECSDPELERTARALAWAQLPRPDVAPLYIPEIEIRLAPAGDRRWLVDATQVPQAAGCPEGS